MCVLGGMTGEEKQGDLSAKVKTTTTKNKRNEAGGIDIIPCAL